MDGHVVNISSNQKRRFCPGCKDTISKSYYYTHIANCHSGGQTSAQEDFHTQSEDTLLGLLSSIGNDPGGHETLPQQQQNIGHTREGHDTMPSKYFLSIPVYSIQYF